MWPVPSCPVAHSHVIKLAHDSLETHFLSPHAFWTFGTPTFHLPPGIPRWGGGNKTEPNDDVITRWGEGRWGGFDYMKETTAAADGSGLFHYRGAEKLSKRPESWSVKETNQQKTLASRVLATAGSQP